MSVMDLSGIVDSLGIAGNVEFERATGSITWTNGDPIDPGYNVISMRAIVQPATPRELMRLPEGDRTRETMLVHTKSQLVTTTVKDKKLADRMRYDSRTWEIVRCEDWSRQGNFWRSFAQKIEEG